MLAIPTAANPGSDVHFEWLVEKAAQERKRLTIVAVLLTESGYVGIGKQNNREGNWSLVQGQVEKNEGVVSALWRELNDELGLKPWQVEAGDMRFLFSSEAPYPSHRADPLFPNGKLYACFAALIRGRIPYELNANEEMINWTFTDPYTAEAHCVHQPGVLNPPEETKLKGTKVLVPAIHTALLRFGFAANLKE